MKKDSAEFQILLSNCQILLSTYDWYEMESMPHVPAAVYTAVRALADTYGNGWINDKQAERMNRLYERAKLATGIWEQQKANQADFTRRKYRSIQ